MTHPFGRRELAFRFSLFGDSEERRAFLFWADLVGFAPGNILCFCSKLIAAKLRDEVGLVHLPGCCAFEVHLLSPFRKLYTPDP